MSKYYVVDIDLSTDIEVLETVEPEIGKFDTLEEAKAFALDYAKKTDEFDFYDLYDNEFYELTIREFTSESDWDDIDSVVVENPNLKER